MSMEYIRRAYGVNSSAEVPHVPAGRNERTDGMAQMTEDLANEALRACAYDQHPALTVRETEQLLRAWFEREVLRAERDHARATIDNAGKLLGGIYALMYPAPVTMPDGRRMVFRPNSPDPHLVLQELSDRIRALPDELLAHGVVKPNVG